MLTEMGLGDNHASTWLIFINLKDRFTIISIYSGDGVRVDDEGLDLHAQQQQQQQKADTQS